MALKYKYQSMDEIPEAVRANYTERDGAFILNVEGMPEDLSANVSRLTESLQKERNDHKATREKLRVFDEFGSADDIRDRLESAGKGVDQSELLTLRKQVRGFEQSKAELERLRGVESKAKIDAKLREVITGLPANLDRDKINLLLNDKSDSGQIKIDEIGDLSVGGKPITEYVEAQAKLFGFFKQSTPGNSNPGNGAIKEAPVTPKYEEAKKKGDIGAMLENAPQIKE